MLELLITEEEVAAIELPADDEPIGVEDTLLE